MIGDQHRQVWARDCTRLRPEGTRVQIGVRVRPQREDARFDQPPDPPRDAELLVCHVREFRGAGEWGLPRWGRWRGMLRQAEPFAEQCAQAEVGGVADRAEHAG